MHQSFCNARTAVEQTDWHDEAERVFVDSLARWLDMAIAAGEPSDLIIFGAPRSALSACCQETGSLGLRQRAGRNAMELVPMHQYLQPAGRVVTATIGVSHAALRPSV
ncbi:host attachment protein [Polaromonas sp. DSR2-3-2]|uniref:host attachment protein n=1 Tax=Polaromonas sp. DSR2-3-2 TaxID=2804622 RepID=UPI003CF249BF